MNLREKFDRLCVPGRYDLPFGVINDLFRLQDGRYTEWPELAPFIVNQLNIIPYSDRHIVKVCEAKPGGTGVVTLQKYSIGVCEEVLETFRSSAYMAGMQSPHAFGKTRFSFVIRQPPWKSFHQRHALCFAMDGVIGKDGQYSIRKLMAPVFTEKDQEGECLKPVPLYEEPVMRGLAYARQCADQIMTGSFLVLRNYMDRANSENPYAIIYQEKPWMPPQSSGQSFS